MILKAVGMSWLTVVRMMQVKGGFRSPEDLKRTPLINPAPNPKQLEPNERVERIRHILMNDVENLPFFPDRRLPLHPNATIVAARAMAALRPTWCRDCCTLPPTSAQMHEVRAAFWTVRLADPRLHYRADVARSVGQLMMECAGRRVGTTRAATRLRRPFAEPTDNAQRPLLAGRDASPEAPVSLFFARHRVYE